MGSQSMVPVISRPPSSTSERVNKGKAPIRHPPRRQYEDGPLPVKPDTKAPKNARIVDREQEHDGAIVKYKLKIGEVEINDVGVDEILEYVSPWQLEQFEMVKFREEAEILRVLEQDRDEQRRDKLARAAESARTRGAVFVEEDSDSEALAALATADDPEDVPLGKHGRARPDYSKFYKPPPGKSKALFEDYAPRTGSTLSGASEHELSKRRRRKRDPITGEVLPLPTILPSHTLNPVRRRRKRHPVTGELMPHGWRYNPELEEEAPAKRRDGQDLPMKEASFKRLSISEQHDAKRPRLDIESMNSGSASPVPTKAEIMGQAYSHKQTSPKSTMEKQTAIVDLMSTDEEPEIERRAPGSSTKARLNQAANSMMRGTMGSTATTSASESSTGDDRPSAISPSASQRTPKVPQRTSILSPSAARASSTDPLAAASDNEGQEDKGDDGEWVIEAILGHRMSDPKTHPPELGHESVMLYSVKWDGYDQPTWEPVESFGDRATVDEYRKKAKLPPLPPEDESEYEIDRITAHHLSDPRTHPPRLGKTPVMLYQVSWQGFEESTWEPEASFSDNPKILKVYKRQHGLS